jgi:hypothetical protein
MRRIFPWLLVCMLGLATGLGAGLGLAYRPEATRPSPSSRIGVPHLDPSRIVRDLLGLRDCLSLDLWLILFSGM